MGKNQARYGNGSGHGTRQPDEFSKRESEGATHIQGKGTKTLWLKSHVHSKQTLGMQQVTHTGKRRQNPMMGATRIKGKGDGKLTGIAKTAIPSSFLQAGSTTPAATGAPVTPTANKAAGTPTALVKTGKSITANPGKITKRDRYYDPEANRQNRQGTYQGAGAAAGVYGIGSGVRGIMNDRKESGATYDTKDLGKITRGTNRAGKPFIGGAELTDSQRARLEAALGKGKGLRVRGIHAGKIGVGAAALGTAAAFRRHSLSERNRAYN